MYLILEHVYNIYIELFCKSYNGTKLLPFIIYLDLFVYDHLTIILFCLRTFCLKLSGNRGKLGWYSDIYFLFDEAYTMILTIGPNTDWYWTIWSGAGWCVVF